MSIATTGNESKQHINAKRRLFDIVEDLGMVADFEIRTGTTETTLGPRDYTVDLFAFWTHARTGVTEKIAFEVEGYKGHNSTRQRNRDKFRDQVHAEKGIKTVRIQMYDLIGRDKLDDNTISLEILYQLKNPETLEYFRKLRSKMQSD
jgi:hypothetical protein